MDTLSQTTMQAVPTVPVVGGLVAAASVEVAAPDGAPNLHYCGVDGLTPRQRQVCELVARGNSNKEVADALGLSEGTVKTHLKTCFRWLRIHHRSQLVALFPTMDRPAQALPKQVTNADRELFGHLLAGESDREISAALNLSENAVKSRVRKLFNEYGFFSRTQAAAWWYANRGRCV